ncbi:RdRP-domain-containing protein [Coniochaeta ligniaria NRRL 30616]|uniref:RNA-directed RNA polymerase n=1 Tax=Coniochaeta ligniaria NRRL 30616 TaxID=1408157 RepID=A0A1J7IU60_9PEZI|nr:RdRP-domain-containing protein [Coniochaeta ligniaria NRRL 30616]
MATDWSNLRSVLFTLSQVPEHTSTLDLWVAFEPWGNIVYIDIEENAKSERTGIAKIRFDPPPKEPVQPGSGCEITIQQRKVWLIIDNVSPCLNEGGVRSPLNNQVPAKVVLKPSSLTFGVMVEPTKFMSMRTVSSLGINDELGIAVDFRRRKLEITLPVFIEDKDRPELPPFGGSYRMEAKFEGIAKVYRVSNAKTKAVIIAFEFPPRFFRRKGKVEKTHDPGRLNWGENDLWARVVGITHDLEMLKKMPASLENNQHYIDLGRWTTYRLDLGPEAQDQWKTIEEALVDWNIKTAAENDMQIVPRTEPRLWSMVESATLFSTNSAMGLLASVEWVSLPFDVRYQLEVCISHGVLEERNITREFLLKLQSLSAKKVQDQNRARLALEYAADQKKRIFEPMSLFDDRGAMTFYPPCTHIPAHCALVRKVTVTPTRIYFHTPTLETTNRVLRHYSPLQDNFLRVSFMDELNDGRINGSDTIRDNELYTRAFRVLNNGIRMGRWHWQFLAFGNSQIRENGAFFFCEERGETCESIRKWMGRFTHIKVVAKYAARLGQCFSTTRLLRHIPAPTIVSIPDVERNSYCFTDGVGKISSILAKMIADEWKEDSVPSAFQFRMGGCKGVLVTWPEAKDIEVHIRKSQEKFSSEFNGLEIIRLSHYTTATLNRQTISILSCLGVPDSVFMSLLLQELRNYDRAMTDRTFATKLLRQYVDESQSSLMIAGMLDYGFMEANEPYVKAMLELWRSWSIKYLKEKARIPIAESAFVLGCIDETGTLKGHINKKRRRNEKPVKELPEIFLQISDPDNRGDPRIITGVCIVGRNPSLHPGDIRVVKAVDVPALRHLRDVVVFPMQGDRDIPSMCSGGDLDGDDFFVIWDKNLIPNEWCHIPMDFEPPAAKELDHEPTVQDLTMFFTLYMKNNSLPIIAHSHLAHADFRDSGAKDPRCVELAKLHSKAVDYVKTGVPAEMEKKLKPRAWPHFMEKRNSYRSFKILGQMYDRVNRVHFTPNYEMSFDARILKRYTLDNEMLKKARHIKSQYDTALKRIMGSMEIRTEFEVLSTFVMSKPRVGTQYKMHETVRRETDALRHQFKDECIEAAGGSREFKVLAPFVAAMYQVTHEEVQIALYESRSPHVRKDGTQGYRQIKPESMPLISFPWLFDGILGRIAKGSSEAEQQAKTSADKKEVPATDSKQAPSLDYEDLKNMEYARTSSGIVHRGQILRLFHHTDEDDVMIEEEEKDKEEQQFLQPMTDVAERDPVAQPSVETRPNQQLKAPAASMVRRTGNLRNGPINGPSDGFLKPPSKANKITPEEFRTKPQNTTTTTTTTISTPITISSPIITSEENNQSSSVIDTDEDLISFDDSPPRAQQTSAVEPCYDLSLLDQNDNMNTRYAPQTEKQQYDLATKKTNSKAQSEIVRPSINGRGFMHTSQLLAANRRSASERGNSAKATSTTAIPPSSAMISDMFATGSKEKKKGEDEDEDEDDDEDLEVEEVVLVKKDTTSAFEHLAKFA